MLFNWHPVAGYEDEIKFRYRSIRRNFYAIFMQYRLC
jgi:hypothetical protein